jgi:hypothetical protein
MSDTELKPCPFCGGKAKVSLFLGNYCVTCCDCLGSIVPDKGMTKDYAIKAWNRREKQQMKRKHFWTDGYFVQVLVKLVVKH